MIPALPARARTVVDAYDLIWRAHEMDADTATRRSRRWPRRAYSRSVRVREVRAIRRADLLLVAGWTDLLEARSQGAAPALWAPTGLGSDPARVRPVRDRTAVGLIGNFAHSATEEAAQRLESSPLGDQDSIEIVFAGLGSASRRASATNTRALGPVRSVNDFYDEIDITVVPVANGAGIKTKLAESILAGRAVITTPQGAAGYPPELAASFVVVEPEQLTPQLISDVVARFDASATREAFAAKILPDSAAQIYRDALAA